MADKANLIASYLRRVAASRASKLDRIMEAHAQRGLESAEAPEASKKRGLAQEGVDRIKKGNVPAAEQVRGLEAIILPKIRPVLDVEQGTFRTDHPLWLHLNDDPIKAALLAVIPSVGRLELPGNDQYPYGGTGFVVGGNLIMTNRHVAEIFRSGVGSRVRI